MRFQVPQFIDVEDKIFGPMTFKQFIYLGGGIGLCFIDLKLFPKYMAYVLILPIAALSLALAFYKPNGRPFILILESAFNYSIKTRLYLWKKTDKKAPAQPMSALDYRKISLPAVSQSKLKDMSWELDMKKEEK